MDFFQFLTVACCLAFAGFVINKFIGMIKTWINRKKPAYDQEKFDRLAKAFIQHKKRTERRMKKLESHINKGEPKPAAKIDGQVMEKQLSMAIEIAPNQPNEQTQTGNDKLENTLKQK